MTGMPYEDDILKEIVAGCKTRSELYAKIKKALVENPYFRDGPKRNVHSVFRAIQTRGLIEGLKSGFVIAPEWTDEKKNEFIADFSNSGLTVADVTKKYNLKSDRQTRNFAGNWGARRSKRGAKTKNIYQLRNIDSAMTKMILELVHSGILKKKKGLDALYAQAIAKFSNVAHSREQFEELVLGVAGIVWTQKDVDSMLQQIVRKGHDDDRDHIKKYVFPLLSYLPQDIVEARLRWHRGVAPRKKLVAEHVVGVGRIGIDDVSVAEAKKFEIPGWSSSTPLRLRVKDKRNWNIPVLNGINIGIMYPQDIVGNRSRQALSTAQHQGAEAVFLTNILDMDVHVAGKGKVGRALLSGANISLDTIQDPVYREKAKQILAVKTKRESAVYRTKAELFIDFLNGLQKIFGTPKKGIFEYSGPVYIVLGPNEQALMKDVARAEVRYFTKRDRNKLELAKKGLIKGIAQAVRDEDDTLANLLREKLNQAERELDRTYQTLADDSEYQLFYKMALLSMVKKIEAAIPGSKVVGMDTVYLKVGDAVGQIVMPSTAAVSVRHLSNFCKDYAQTALEGEKIDFVVVCPPYSLHFRHTQREMDSDGGRGDMKVYVAPVAVDGDFLRSILKPSMVKEHPLGRAVFSRQFNPGVMRIVCNDGNIDAESLSLPALEAYKRYPEPTEAQKKRIPKLYQYGPDYINLMIGTDLHYGSRNRVYLTDPETRKRFGITECVMHLLRKAGLCKGDNLPVHFYATLDDYAQGQNFPAYTQQHPHQMPFDVIERKALELEQRGEVSKMREFLMYQLEKRGSDLVTEQMEQVMDRHIEPNLDFFNSVLLRARSAGIFLKTIGDFDQFNPEHFAFDARNIGIVNANSGNHVGNTVEGQILEAPFYVKFLQARLSSFPAWRNQMELLKKWVVAPTYSGFSVGWGVISIEGQHEYGLDIRSRPTKMAGWTDPLLGATQNIGQRGNISRIHNGKLPVIYLVGDKHFFATADIGYCFFHMSAPDTETDRFAEWAGGLPPNNTGVSFVCLPVDGPGSGPILVRTLSYSFIRDVFQDNPRRVNWNRILPCPA